MFNRVFILMMLVFFIGVSNTPALEIGGVNMPDTLMIGKEKLVLNGAGLRKKFFVKVYAGALYLKSKSSDADKIIQADEPMGIKMHWIYDGVEGKKIIDGWNSGFESGTNGKTAPIQKEIDQFNSYFENVAHSNDIFDILYQPGQGVQVLINGKLKGTIKGYEFKKAVFSIWLGNNPELSKLRKGMLNN